jgi:hypothetical protein
MDLHRDVPRDLLVALEPVVDRLGDLEELLVAVDDAPVRCETEALEHRDLGGQDLGDTTAVLGRVDVQDLEALHAGGGLGEAVDHGVVDDAAELFDAAWPDGDYAHGLMDTTSRRP